MAWPAAKRNFDKEGFRKYVLALPPANWRGRKVMWHNTAAPTLKQWMESAERDRVAGKVPGITRIENLERFFHDDNHWSGCPHLFVANDFIWVMNPLTAPGVHSPSFNVDAFGIEMIGDFDRETDEDGLGLSVKLNTIYATAVLCEAFGIPPVIGETDRHMRKVIGGTIFIHKQDWATTHDCPGKNIAEDHGKMVKSVADLMAGGEHNPEHVAEVIAKGQPKVEPASTRFGRATTDLNFRVAPSALSELRGSLPPNMRVTILGEAPNGSDRWFRVKTPAGYVGWVAGKFINEEKKA